MRVKDAVGRFGEDVAVQMLRDAGMTVLERNWRCPEGEIDVVALDGDVLVVVEVKTRSSALFGAPVEAVGRAKAARLRRLTARWLAEHRQGTSGWSGTCGWSAVRIDVVGVLRSASGVEVEHLRGAVG